MKVTKTMLRLLFSLILNFVLINCDNDAKVPALFNESILIAKHHHHLKQVQTFLKTVHQKIHEESALKDLEYETTGHENLHYSTDLRNATTDSISTFVSTVKESKEGIMFRAYVPYSPLKSSALGSVEAGGFEQNSSIFYTPEVTQSSIFYSPVETTVTVNWYEYFSLPSPTSKTPHPRGYYSKYRRPRRTTEKLYKTFGLPSPGSEHDVTSPTSSSALPNTSSSSVISHKPSLTITPESTVDLNKQFGHPSPISVRPTFSSSFQRPSEANKPVFTSHTVATMNLNKQSGLPSNTPVSKNPLKSPTPGDTNNSHPNTQTIPLTNETVTTVNLYLLFGLPSPTTKRHRVRKYTSYYPKKKKPYIYEPTGYEMSSEDPVPVERDVFPPILYSSEVITPESMPLYQQYERISPSTVLSYNVESLQPSPNSQSYQRGMDRPIYQRGMDVSPTSLRETVTRKSKSLTSILSNTNFKQIWAHELNNTLAEKWLHSLTTRDMTPYTNNRRQNKQTTSTRKVRGRLRSRQLRASRQSPGIVHQGISLHMSPVELEDHSLMLERRPVFKAYDQKIADTASVSPYKLYDNMMDQLNEGYMTVFLMELSRLVSSKEPNHVRDIFGHTDSVVIELFERAQLVWFGQPLSDVTVSLSRFLAEVETDTLKSYASTLHHLLATRRSALAADINSIIDGANQLYEPAEGYSLFDNLMEFDKYPDTRTGRQVCEGLIKSFLHPFRRLHHSKQRQELLVSINDALETRFPGYRLRSSEDSSGDDEENQSRSMKYVLKRTRKNKRRQRKRHHRPKTELNENSHRRYYTQVEIFRTRSMKPITEQQKRFSIIIPKHRRGNTHTDAQFQDVRTRRTTDYTHTHAKQFFHDEKLGSDDELGNRREFKRYRGDLKTDGKVISAYLQMNRSEDSRSEKARLKTEILRRIADSSSYSDEEEALKSNLVQALMQGNGSAVGVIGKTAVTADDGLEKSVRGIENKEILRPSEESDLSLEDKDSAIQNEL